MATIKTSKQLINALAQGKYQRTLDLRDKILNPAELHYLVLLDDQIDSIIKYLESPQGKTEFSDQNRAGIETLLATAPEFEEGYLVREDATYNQLKVYLDLLNKSHLNEQVYELGHETGVLTRLLQLLKENFTPKDTAYGSRQRALMSDAIKASLIIDNIDEDTLKKIKKFMADQGKSLSIGKIGGSITLDELEDVLKAAGSVMDLEVTAEKNITDKLTGKTLKIALRPELKSVNQYTGKLSNALSKSVKAGFDSGTGKGSRIDDILKNVDIFNLTGSPSIMDSVKDKLDDIFFERKKKPNKHVKSKVRTKRRIPTSNQAAKSLKKRVKIRTAHLKTLILARKRKKRFIIPTLTLKALINESLHIFVANRMGGSNDPAIKLRYQTGRFSESAKLLTLNRVEAGAYIGTYDFQKNPYSVFLPGERLGTQQRDPKLYIEGAIRDIAKGVLGKNFNGINVRLV